MIKNTLYAIAVVLLCVSAYHIYHWYISEPANKEPLPALISSFATIILAIIAWQLDGNPENKVKVSKIGNSAIVDIDEKFNKAIDVSEVKGQARVFINKGKDSLKQHPPQKPKTKNTTEQDNPQPPQ